MDKLKKNTMVEFCKALANSDRLAILQLVKKERTICAQDIEKRFYLEQSTVSYHLQLLLHAGVLEVVRIGRKRYYSVHKKLEETFKNFSELAL